MRMNDSGQFWRPGNDKGGGSGQRAQHCVFLCLLWPFGSNAAGGREEGSGTLSGVCSWHSTVVLTGPEVWGTSCSAEMANSQTPD